MTREQIEAKMTPGQMAEVKKHLEKGGFYHAIHLVKKFANIHYKFAFAYCNERGDRS